MPKTAAAIQSDLFVTEKLSGPRFDTVERAEVVEQLRTLLQEAVTTRATEAIDDADNA